MNKRILLITGLATILTAVMLSGCQKKEARDISDESEMADSIVYANTCKNAIQCYYDDELRYGFYIDNLTTRIKLNLQGEGKQGIVGIYNEKGKPLLENGISSYAINNSGTVFSTDAAVASSRVNTSKMGYYYYEVNNRGLTWGVKSKTEEEYVNGSEINIMPTGDTTSENVELSRDGNAIKGIIADKNNSTQWDTNAAVDSDSFVRIKLSFSGTVTRGSLYYLTSASESDEFNTKQRVNFTFDSDGQPHDVLIPLNLKEAQTLTKIKIVFTSAKKNNKFSIQNAEIVSIRQPDTEIITGVENTFHSYSDKIMFQNRIIFDRDIDSYKEFGTKYVIPKKNVQKLENHIEDKGYVGIVTKNGILGFILPSDNFTQGSISEEGDNYVIRFFVDISGEHAKTSSVKFAHRIYTSSDKDLSKLETEAYIERNPIEVKVTGQEYEYSNFGFVEYDKYLGAYKFTVQGQMFATYYVPNTTNDYYGGSIEITGDDYDRNVYVFVQSSKGYLEGGCLLDGEKELLPISPQVGKNFCGEYEEPYYDPLDPEYSYIVYPLKAAKNAKYSHSVLEVFQQWGNYKLKQISSIAFHIGYYHLSTGFTESNCIAPYFVFGRDGWTLPDFRGCSGNIWGGQPQFNSVGRLRFVETYSEDTGNYPIYPEYTGSDIKSSGLTYAEIDYSYKSAEDGLFDYTLTHIEYPSSDENRTMYTLDLKVNKSFTVDNARENFILFSFDGRFGIMKKTSYLDENGVRKTIEHDTLETTKPSYYTIKKGTSYVSYYNTDEQSIENFAILIKDYDMKIGGRKWNGNLGFVDYVFSENGQNLNYFGLSLDEDKIRFKKGDTIHINFILLPFGTANQDNDNNALNVYEDSILNPFTVSNVKTGKVVKDDWKAVVRAENNVAEFTVKGSRDVTTVVVQGYEHLGKLKVEEYIDGKWTEIDLSVKDYDGYQVNYMEDGYFQYSFNFMQESPLDEHTFRVTVED